MNMLTEIVLLAIVASACAGCSTYVSSGKPGPHDQATSLSEDERHRLFSAALAASESPLESEIFKDACRKIGVFDTVGEPNDKYMAFVAAHVDWAMKTEVNQFRREIDTREKALEYLRQHLPR